MFLNKSPKISYSFSLSYLLKDLVVTGHTKVPTGTAKSPAFSLPEDYCFSSSHLIFPSNAVGLIHPYLVTMALTNASQTSPCQVKDYLILEKVQGVIFR